MGPMTLIDLEQEISPELKQAIDETRQRIRECFYALYRINFEYAPIRIGSICGDD